MTGPTVPSPADRFYQPRLTDLIWIPAVAGAFPTLAEVTAGTVIDTDLAGITGFTTTLADLPTKDYGDSYIGSIPGDETPDASSLQFWADPTGADASAYFAKGDKKHLLVVWQGLANSATSNCTFYKNVRVGTVNRPLDMTNAAQINIGITLGDAPVDGNYPTS